MIITTISNFCKIADKEQMKPTFNIPQGGFEPLQNVNSKVISCVVVIASPLWHQSYILYLWCHLFYFHMKRPSGHMTKYEIINVISQAVTGGVLLKSGFLKVCKFD